MRFARFVSPYATPAARRLLPLALAALGACGKSGATAAPPAPAAERQPTTARELVERMRGRWGSRWYRSIQYQQASTSTVNGRETRSAWAKYQTVPGRQRLELLPAGSGSGALLVDNVQRTYTSGRVTDTRTLVNGLVLLGADIYVLPVDRTMRLLDSLRVDTTKFYATRGVRQTYVVGALPGDTASTQFWVDGDSLLLRRFVQRSTTQGRARVADTRLAYQAVDGLPVPRETVFLRDGQPYLREEYSQVKVNAPLAPELFDPERWTTAPRP